MFEDYQDIIIAGIIIFVLHFIIKNMNIEHMSPIGHRNNKHWECGDKHLSSQDIIDLRNTEFNHPALNHTVESSIDYQGTNYNPAHLDHTTHESAYVIHEGDEGEEVAEPDKFNSCTYW